MYEVFYGLKEKPFSMLPDPGFLFLSKKHRAALTLLEYGLLNHVGFCVITGEPGAGKTTILRALLDAIDKNVTVGLITNTHQSFGGLLDWILSVFDLHKPGLTHVEMHQIFMEFLIEEYAHKRSVLLIVDEAQNMKAETLEELRMLSNVNTEKDQLLQVVLAGQPSLRDTLRTPELMQFAQRIAVDYHLDALNLQETCGYIQHRLLTAGAQRDIFTPEACERIYNYSGGTPRLINLLCETVMVYGFADVLDVIDIGLVDEMVLERMKDSVVPIKNRDIARAENKEASKLIIENFPWIQPEGGTKGLKPEINEAGAGSEPLKKNENIAVTSTSKITTVTEALPPQKKKPVEVSASQKTGLASASVKTTGVEPVQKKNTITPPAPAPEKVATTKVPAKAFSEAHANISAAKTSVESKTKSTKPYIKYGVVTIILLLIFIIGMAMYSASENKKKTERLKEEASQMQRQQEQETARLKQMQLEAVALKSERDAALAKVEEEKLAREDAFRLAEEKAVLEAKAVEESHRKEEKKRLAIAEEMAKKARQSEIKAALAAKQAAVKIEQERLLLQSRLEEEIRLKNQQEVLRLELEQELERQELARQNEQALPSIEVVDNPVVERVISSPVESLIECSGPAARFKAACR